MAENEHDLDIEDDIDPNLLQQITHLLTINAPQLINHLNHHGFVRQNDVDDVIDDIINSDNSDEDSTYVPSLGNDESIDSINDIADHRDLILHSPINVDDDHHHSGPRDEPVIDGECDCNFFNNNSNQCLLSYREHNWLDINSSE